MKSFLRLFSSLPLNHSRRVVVSYKRKYVHKVLVYRLPRKKVWLGELTDHLAMTIAVYWDIKQQIIQLRLKHGFYPWI